MADKAQYLTKKVEEAHRHEESNNVGESIKIYEEVIKFPLIAPDEVTDDAVKAKETAVYKLAHIFKEKGLYDELVEL
jgi:hypothetical protein